MGARTGGETGVRVQTASLTGVHWLGIGATLVTAGIHVFLGVRLLPGALGVALLSAGLGFLGAVGLVLVDYRRRLVYAAGVPFTVGQVVLWYSLNFAAGSKTFPGDVGAFGAVDKLAQAVLLAVLAWLLWTSQ